jgi:hypothetical protein
MNTNVNPRYFKLRPTEYQKEIKEEIDYIKSNPGLSKEDLVNRLRQHLSINSIYRKRLDDHGYIPKMPRIKLVNKLLSVLRRKLKNIDNRRYANIPVPDFNDYYSFCTEWERIDFPEQHYFRRDYTSLPRKKLNGWIDPEWISYWGGRDKKNYYLDRLSVKERRNLNIAYRNIKELIEGVFIVCNRVQVIRMDFHLKNGENDLEKLNGCFSKLTTWLAREYKGFLGYFGTREVDKKDNVHLHSIMFFNGGYVSNDCIVGKQISNKWKELSKGRSFCSNFIKERYPDEGEILGLIEYNELAKIEKLLVLSKYLIKDISDRDWVERLGFNPRARLFTCSIMSNYSAKANDYYDRLALNGVETKRKFLVDYRWLDKMQLKNGPPLFSGEDGLLRMKNYVRLNPNYVKEANYVPLDVLERRVTNDEYFSKHGEILSKLD